MSRAELNVYPDRVVSLMDDIAAGRVSTFGLRDRWPALPADMASELDSDIINVLYECDSFPKTFRRYRDIFARHPSLADLQTALDDDRNGCD